MNFYLKLKEYMELLHCTAKELSLLSGISAASISRYKNGEQAPKPGTEAFNGLCEAIAEIAAQKNISDVTVDSVKEEFTACEDFISADKEVLRQNLNTLISALDINLTQLRKYTNYDASAIFRIRNGTRRPSDPGRFASDVASFVARKMQTPQEVAAVAKLIGCDADTVADQSIRCVKLKSWLLEQSVQETENHLARFLSKLDTFDLNEYKTIGQSDLMVPSKLRIATKTYFGMDKMAESELDFMKATVLSNSTAAVTMYSDMPIKDTETDQSLMKKLMFGVAMMLKKGLHLNVIHNIYRSIDEMMLGLLSWIPMYMTGQISPYYFKNTQNNIFLHCLCASGAAALSGEAIAGYHNDGKFYLTKSKREVEYYYKRADEMLKNAYPLMEIYRSERENEWNAFMKADAQKPGRRRSILSTLPIYTISKELLDSILTRHGVNAMLKQKIEEYYKAQKQRITAILTSTFEVEIPTFDPQEFRKNPPSLELSGIFCEADIAYKEEEYIAHLSETKAFAEQNPNYAFKMNDMHVFRNIQILIREGRWAMVSKDKAPTIHFVIRHPKLRSAIEDLFRR